MALNHTFDQMYLIGIFRIFHPKIAQYTFFSSTHQIFSRIDHVLDHKTSLHKLKRTEIIPRIFSDHSAMNLEINCKKNSGKHTHTAWLNNIQPNKERSTKKSKRKFKNTWIWMKMKHNSLETFGSSKSYSKREF